MTNAHETNGFRSRFLLINYAGESAQRICHNRLLSGIFKSVRIRRVSDFAGLVSEQAVPRIACRHIGKRRNVDLAALVMPCLLSVVEELCASSPVERWDTWRQR